MFGSIAKSYFAEKLVLTVKFSGCIHNALRSQKYECTREEFSVDGNPDVDYSVSTRELANLIKRANIDFIALPDWRF